MADFFSDDALAIRTRLQDGRKTEALRMLYEALHAGSADADVQRIAPGYILDLIEPYPNPRGRPAQVGPQRWAEIGEYYLAERARGRNHTRALRETWADFTFSREHIRKAVRFFQIARGGVTT